MSKKIVGAKPKTIINLDFEKINIDGFPADKQFFASKRYEPFKDRKDMHSKWAENIQRVLCANMDNGTDVRIFGHFSVVFMTEYRKLFSGIVKAPTATVISNLAKQKAEGIRHEMVSCPKLALRWQSSIVRGGVKLDLPIFSSFEEVSGSGVYSAVCGAGTTLFCTDMSMVDTSDGSTFMTLFDGAKGLLIPLMRLNERFLERRKAERLAAEQQQALDLARITNEEPELRTDVSQIDMENWTEVQHRSVRLQQLDYSMSTTQSGVIGTSAANTGFTATDFRPLCDWSNFLSPELVDALQVTSQEKEDDAYGMGEALQDALALIERRSVDRLQEYNWGIPYVLAESAELAQVWLSIADIHPILMGFDARMAIIEIFQGSAKTGGSIRVSLQARGSLYVIKVFDPLGDDDCSIKFYHRPERYDVVKSCWSDGKVLDPKLEAWSHFSSKALRYFASYLIIMRSPASDLMYSLPP